MDPHGLGSRLVDWLCKNPTLVPFIAIDVCLGDSSSTAYEEQKASIGMRRQAQILRLNRFSSEVVETALSCLLAPGRLPQPPVGSPSSVVWDWHLCLWTRYKLFKLRKRDLQALLVKTKDLTDVLRDPEIVPACVEFTLNERDFTQSMLNGSMQYFVLTEFLKVIHADYSIGCPRPLANGMDLKPLLLRILNKIAQSADHETFYFPITQAEDEFEALLFSGAFPCSEQRDAILAGLGDWPRTDLRKRILEFASLMTHCFMIQDKLHTSVCIVLLFRLFFERAYCVKPTLFYPNKLLGLQNLARLIHVADLEIDPKFLPECDTSATVYDAFSGSPFFSESGQFLEHAILHTNPFDALYEISEMIACIEKHAGGLHLGGLLPFEVTFGFYIAIILLSGLPSFEELAEFIAECAPVEGLCPVFEFASATTAAARRYCRTLRLKFGIASVDANSPHP
jgi:hypothetical protein